MKRILTATLVVVIACATLAAAQEQPSGQQTLAATMNVYVFPTAEQSAKQQSKHEAECYTWAVDTTKNDPFELANRAQQAQQSADHQKEHIEQAGQGAGAKGALGGAAVGALVGEIVNDDAGKGAAWGAAAGAIGARRKVRRPKQQASQQVDQQAQRTQQATAEDLENFKKAFGVCLEAKKYLAKF